MEITGNGGWTLRTFIGSPGQAWIPGPPRITLDNLIVTAEQADMIESDQRHRPMSYSVSRLDGRITVSGIELTEAEAVEISGSGDPWQVLGLSGPLVRLVIVPSRG